MVEVSGVGVEVFLPGQDVTHPAGRTVARTGGNDDSRGGSSPLIALSFLLILS